MRLTSPHHSRASFDAFFRLVVLQFFTVSASVVMAQEAPTTSQPSAPSPAPVSPSVNSAQFTPASAAGYPGMTPSTAFAGTSQLPVSPLTAAGNFLTSGLLTWGPVNLHPHLSYDVSYGNGLQPLQGQRANTLINIVSPGLLATAGSHWSLDYTPSLHFYSDHRFQDGVDHTVNLNGGTTYEDWSFGLVQGFSSSTQPLIETGAQTDQQTYLTALSAAYQMSSKMSLSFNVNQNLRYVSQQFVAQPLANTREWSTQEGFNYLFAPRFSAGISAGFTYDNLSVGPDITSEQLSGQMNWRATDKLSFAVSGGIDVRQFLSSHQPDLLSPIFSASVQYQLFENTSLSLVASRSVSPSYFAGAVSEGTTVSAGLHQRLLGRLYLDVSGAYSTTTYKATTTTIFGPANTSSFDNTSFIVRLSTTFLKRATAAIYFQENFVSSSSTGAAAALYNYTTTVAGLDLGYRF